MVGRRSFPLGAWSIFRGELLLLLVSVSGILILEGIFKKKSGRKKIRSIFGRYLRYLRVQFLIGKVLVTNFRKTKVKLGFECDDASGGPGCGWEKISKLEVSNQGC